VTVDGDLVNRSEIFDEAAIDTALTRFDELNQQALQLENAATRAQGRVVDAFNSHNLDSFLAIHDGQYEDRRRVMRDEGPVDAKFARAMLFEKPETLQMESEPIAIRGHRLSLNRVRWRDMNEADRPIAVELLNLVEVNDYELVSYVIFFDPDDIDAAIGELSARWIASGEAEHPDVIESADRVTESVHRHDWDAVAAQFVGAAYVNHRQLAQTGTDTVADWLSSMRTIESLVPDFWVELVEVLALSAKGLVGRMALKGTSTDGAAIEIPYVLLMLLDADRVTRFESFDPDQRELALARFHELNQA
jgi:hypothetical protein